MVRRHVQDRAGGEDGRVLVRVGDLPVEVVVLNPGQQFTAAVGVDRLEFHPLAAVVHVGLEADQLDRPVEHAVAVVADVVRAGRDGELVVAPAAVAWQAGEEPGGDDPVLRHDSLGVEAEADALAVADLLAERVVVAAETDFGAGHQQLAGVLGVNVARVADRVLDEQ